MTSFVYFNSNNKPVTIPDNKFPLKIIVHGWNDMKQRTDTTGWAQNMKNAILSASNTVKRNYIIHYTPQN